MEKACDSWKIDPKDYKICRNCKKPKNEHQDLLKSKSVGNNNLNKPENVAKEKLITSNTIKEEGENNEKKDGNENAPSFKEKKAHFQNFTDPQKNKNIHVNETSLTKTKEKVEEKKAVEDLSSSSSSGESESKKEREPITKNVGFKNKLEGLFAKGGNPMRMNDDFSFSAIKKNNLNILANGKRASRTYGGFYKICFHLI